MSDLERHIHYLFDAELQFRLASAVRIAVNKGEQPLHLPMKWAHGQHEVPYEEIALRKDQADYAAFLIQRSATYTMAVAIKDAIEAMAPKLPEVFRKSNKDIDMEMRKVIESVVNKPWISSVDDVIAAFHIARLIRNAYAHAPFAPTWKIHIPLQAKVFIISNVVRLDTTGLDGTPLKPQHYGGPLAMFRFCRFVRSQILGDALTPRKEIPIPERTIYQQGSLIVTKVDQIPSSAVPVDVETLPDGGMALGGSVFLDFGTKMEDGHV